MNIVEIVDINDDLLLPWLDLYEVSFPPEEKVLVSDHLLTLKRKALGQAPDVHLAAAVDPAGKLLAIVGYEFDRESSTALLEYLAVVPEMRSTGIGSICYNAICERAWQAGMASMVLEVELAESEDAKSLARRRIDFYRRHGAFLLKGIDYLQTIGSHQPPIPMHIMVHPFRPMNPEEAFEAARATFGESVVRTGPLALE